MPHLNESSSIYNQEQIKLPHKNKNSEFVKNALVPPIMMNTHNHE